MRLLSLQELQERLLVEKDAPLSATDCYLVSVENDRPVCRITTSYVGKHARKSLKFPSARIYPTAIGALKYYEQLRQTRDTQRLTIAMTAVRCVTVPTNFQEETSRLR